MNIFFSEIGDIALNLIIILTSILAVKNRQEIHQLRQEIKEIHEN
jgi:hypothetical protein